MTRQQKIDRALALHKSLVKKIAFYGDLAVSESNGKHTLIHWSKFNLYRELSQRAYKLTMKLLKSPKS